MEDSRFLTASMWCYDRELAETSGNENSLWLRCVVDLQDVKMIKETSNDEDERVRSSIYFYDGSYYTVDTPFDDLRNQYIRAKKQAGIFQFN